MVPQFSDKQHAQRSNSNLGIGILFLIASIFFIIRAFIQFLITGIIFWLQYDTERRLVNSSLKAATNQTQIENVSAIGIGATSNLVLKEALQVMQELFVQVFFAL